jgi:diguanylate cyclase (GGDEF)-like protein/PAS domain S-box-containing protein
MQEPMHDSEFCRFCSTVTDSPGSSLPSPSLLHWLTLALLNRSDRSLSLIPGSTEAASHRLNDVLPGIVFQADSDTAWSMRYLSAGCQALTGYLPEDLLNPDNLVSYNTITHPEDITRVLKTIQQAMDEGQPYVVEYRIQTRSGVNKWVWEKGSPIFNAAGVVVGIEGFITDITPLKQSEAALRLTEQTLNAREDLLELVLDSIPQPLFWKDSQGRYLGCNQPFVQAMGLATPEDIVGGTDSDLLHLDPEEAAYRIARDRLVMAQGTADLHSIELQTYADGHQGWVDCSRLPMRDPDEQVIGVLCLYEDITAQIIDQQTLKRREQTLATLAEIQRQLLAWQWDWQEPSITQVFAALGKISGASCVYYYELQEHPERSHSLCQRIEWSAPGMPSTAKDPRFQVMAVDPLFSDWIAQLTRRHSINVVEAQFSDGQHQLLASYPSDVKSLLWLPLFIQNQLRGVMGFSNCVAPHPWSEAEIDLLRMVTADISLALERRQTELSLKLAEAKYRSIFENAVEGIFQSSPEGRYLTVNPMLARIYGYDSPSELTQTLVNINQQLYVQPSRRQEFVNRIRANGAVLGFESEVYRKDGSIIWISESARAIYDGQHKLMGYEGAVEDITARKLGEAAILRRDRLLQGVADVSQRLLTTADVHQVIPEVLAQLGEAASADRAYVYRHHPQSWSGSPAMTLRYEWTTPTTATGIDQPYWQDQSYQDLGLERWHGIFQRGESICALTRHLPPAEQTVLLRDDILSILMVPIFIGAELWGYIGFDACHQEWEWSAGDESILVAVAASLGGALKRQRTEAQMCYQVYHDALTGLPNRAFFDQHLPEAIARTSNRNQILAVIFLDLDNFKTINDTLSHAVGDLLLQQVTQRISAALRSEDILARWGGDEFTLILPNLSSPSDAAKIAHRIAEQLVPSLFLHNHELHITASVGIALFPEDGQDATTLLQNADVAMYRAKQQGRNNYQFYTQSLSAEAAHRLRLESYLHQALGRNELMLYYQPQINVATGATVQVEALLRWQHPHLGLVTPDRFIPLAEENGLIVPIGEWVLKTACAQVMAWHRQGLPPVKLAVNLSVRQLQHPNLVAMVAQSLAQTGLPANHLELEITETAAMGDVATSIERLQELRNLGIKVSMDDFGTGYSCLSHLKQFPIDGIKIDRAFVKDLPDSPADRAMVNAIIAMAQGLTLSVVAEGVETLDQASCLHSLGCTEMQGYLFGRPQSIEGTADHLRSSLVASSRSTFTPGLLRAEQT